MRLLTKFFISLISLLGNNYGYEQNLALEKHAIMSSRAHFWSKPELANDGDVSQDEVKCTQTLTNATQAWWQVDLSGASILYIHITYAKNSADTMAGFSLYISDDDINFRNGHLCYNHNDSTLPELYMEINCKVHGRFLTFYNERLPDVKYPDGYSATAIIQLCEITVTGCERGRGGFTCTPCSQKCREGICHIMTAKCLECYDGYYGIDCDKVCSNYTYGYNCTERCGKCSNDVLCDHVNGTCAEGCLPGWIEPFCNSSCPTGFYGYKCATSCSGGCRKAGQCDPVDGRCIAGCIAGWKGDRCTESTDPSSLVEEDTNTAAIAIGVVVGVIVIIIAVIVIIVFIRFIQRSDSRIIAREKK
ncbi:multiple epidermal growth factor-like domains protein 10 [Saccostrea cucullata]|uniref:multiple epidermal growth factor-like domains protein 10 n=1 Tax=Saccostrea cuccullata TaxID=36930 RepID=UPI002ED5D782